MCKHIRNAQVAVQAPCCKKFYHCPKCHEETQDHTMQGSHILIMMCLKCRRCFRKDVKNNEIDEADEFCPHCDNHYVLDADVPEEPRLMIGVEGTTDMIRDDRMKRREHDNPFLSQ